MAILEPTTIRINRRRDYSEQRTFSTCDGTPVDLTGYSFVMEIRRSKNAIDPPLLRLTSTPAAGIVILSPATEGKITIDIDDSQTAALPSGVFPFDIYWVSGGGEVETVISGYASVYDSTAV
jgi:hypothetical protein